MNETPFKFTSEEKEQTLQILERLRTAVGDTFKPGDEQHLREDIQHAFINHQIKRNVFGMNPILAALQTAEIAVNEIGLKRDGIIAILMQTSVIDGYQTIEDIQKKYGDSVAHIISGLLRIHDLYKRNPIIESENFRNLLISFSEDMRVILIMIADRVNVMRQIRDTEQKEAKHEVSEEASYLYAPLAHKLGLYKLKSELEEKLPGYYQKALEELQHSADEMTFNANGEQFRIKYQDILYMESRQRVMRLFTLTDTRSRGYFYASMEDTEKQLAPVGFLRVQRSYLVNMAHIQKLNYDKVILTDGTELPVSQKIYSSIKAKYLRWRNRQ